MDYVELLQEWTQWFLGWPLIFYVIPVGCLCTIFLKAVQIRYFLAAWRYTLTPASTQGAACGDMSPVQAFINTLSANLGNGSLAGMATAIYAGGPGAAFWVVVIGLLLMSVRFAEVYLGASSATDCSSTRQELGGPMVYLYKVPGGTILAWVYAGACVLFSLVVGNGIQANSISQSLVTTWGVSPWITATALFLFVFYIVSGGAQRIAHASEKIVPLKVILFFGSSIIVLVYHASGLMDALQLIMVSSFSSLAMAGGVVGFSVQQAIRFGMARSIMATESGLGTAAILFGSTGSKEPVKDAIMSMLSTFISTVVCFMIALSIVVSGVWNSGATGNALTIAAYQTVFGSAGGWIVSFLSVSFGIGVLVAFAYIARQTWLFVTGGRWVTLFSLLYCLVSLVCALIQADLVWTAGEISCALMLITNLAGIVWLLPRIQHALQQFNS